MTSVGEETARHSRWSHANWRVYEHSADRNDTDLHEIEVSVPTILGRPDVLPVLADSAGGGWIVRAASWN